MAPVASFTLVPFGGDGGALAVAGRIARDGRVLVAEFSVEGDISSIVVPPMSATPCRRDLLWQSTCCELFLAVPGATGYLEWNLSPSGDWNCYRFASYRAGMTTAAPSEPPAVSVRRQAAGWRLEAVLPDLAGDRPLSLAPAVVLDHGGEGQTHWALDHPADRPDFHRRPAGDGIRLPVA